MTKIRISAARRHGESGRPVWFIAGDDNERIAVVPWYDGDSIAHAMARMIHCGHAFADYTVTDRIRTGDGDDWGIDEYRYWWFVETRSSEENTVAHDHYRSVPVPEELKTSTRFPHNAASGWWKRGVNDTMDAAHAIIDIGHDLLIDQPETVHALRRDNIRIDQVPAMNWNDVSGLSGVGARRAARLCWFLEKHGYVVAWKNDMTGISRNRREYELIRRNNRKDSS